jgi:hypothetical protein
MRTRVLAVFALLAFPAVARAQHVPSEVSPERQTLLPSSLHPTYEVAAPEPDEIQDRWMPGDAVPPGYHVEHGPDGALLAVGGATFAFGYVLAVVLARADVPFLAGEGATAVGRNDPLYAPLIGPFIAAGRADRGADEIAVLCVDGALQLGGLALFAGGLAVPRAYLERDDGSDVRFSLRPGGAALDVTF